MLTLAETLASRGLWGVPGLSDLGKGLNKRFERLGYSEDTIVDTGGSVIAPSDPESLDSCGAAGVLAAKARGASGWIGCHMEPCYRILRHSVGKG